MEVLPRIKGRSYKRFSQNVLQPHHQEHQSSHALLRIINVLSVFLICIVLLVFATSGAAQIYKWIDKHGTIHFGQSPPQGTESAAKIEATQPTVRDVPNVTRSRGEVETVPPVEKTPSAILEDRPPVVSQQTIAEMYSTSWCGYCRKAREYFQSRGIPLVEYDIEVDPAAAQRKQQIDPRPGVPLVVINGQRIHGFAPARYERALTGLP
jgi:glutaredoxin